MVELKSNDQDKKLGVNTTFSDIPVTVSRHKSLNSSKGVIGSRDLRFCLEEEMVKELSGITQAQGMNRKSIRRNIDIQTNKAMQAYFKHLTHRFRGRLLITVL
ncbi:Gag-like protein [Plakobranchus ocellatus]|uniref:Gag-like protein n=1 Tax=Plakobranchus ocellatus TaxID=259542 RepID=A0AAV4D5C4_9GAST|nr:Gag-like protein [Plakobranchus ocellatus]